MQHPRNSSQYELEMVYGGDPDSTENAVCLAPEEVLRWAAARVQSNTVLTVVKMREEADLGNFLIFTNDDDVAYVRLLEHRGFYAKRTEASTSGHSIAFTSDTGSTFSVAEDSTVPLPVALSAMAHWLATGQPDPQTAWGEE